MNNHGESERSEDSDIKHCDTPNYSPVRDQRTDQTGRNLTQMQTGALEESKPKGKDGHTGEKGGFNIVVRSPSHAETSNLLPDATQSAHFYEGTSLDEKQKNGESTEFQPDKSNANANLSWYDPEAAGLAIRSEELDKKIDGAIERKLLRDSTNPINDDEQSSKMKESQSPRGSQGSEKQRDNTHSYNVHLPELSDSNTQKGSARSIKEASVKSREKTPYISSRS